jgi:hypothetical protein
MKRILGALTACLLALSVIAGCGGSSNSSSDNYCNDVKAAGRQLHGLNDPSSLTAATFTSFNRAVHTIAGEAPSDVKGSWTLIGNQLDLLQSAMSDAGLSMNDLGKLMKGQAPPSTDPSKLQALTQKLQSFNETGLDAAGQKIDREVTSECHIDLHALSH